MENMTRQPVPDGRGVKQGETVHQACWYVERGGGRKERNLPFTYVHVMQHDLDSPPTSTHLDEHLHILPRVTTP